MFTKRKLKIFVDGYLLNKEYQGTKTYIIELYKEFAQENRDVLIYIGCFNSLKVEEYFFGIPNISCATYDLPEPGPPAIKTAFNMPLSKTPSSNNCFNLTKMVLLLV